MQRPEQVMEQWERFQTVMLPTQKQPRENTKTTKPKARPRSDRSIRTSKMNVSKSNVTHNRKQPRQNTRTKQFEMTTKRLIKKNIWNIFSNNNVTHKEKQSRKSAHEMIGARKSATEMFQTAISPTQKYKREKTRRQTN